MNICILGVEELSKKLFKPMFIAENLHIISPKIKQALLDRDEAFVRNLLQKIASKKPQLIDLNVGPSRGKFEGILKWLTPIVTEITDIPLSFDSTNPDEIDSTYPSTPDI